MKTILVVDDERKITNLVRDYLVRAGFQVLTAADGREALDAARERKPDLLVIDLGLPDIDGLDVTRTLRRESPVPMIILTARDEETDKILGLELGADDYMTKPFSPKELVARVRAVLRRSEMSIQGSPSDMVRAGDLEIDLARHQVRVKNQEVELTATEFELLAVMARQPGRVFTRAQLLDAIHGVSFESFERAVDSHVKNLRRKIEPNPQEPVYLIMVYGVGYKLAESNESGAATP
ncbi:MAG: response regulator transcription factor [Anaerolineales bacterium]|nr:response regulator transcription factor [Anaerolineales bacterium]